MSTQPGQHIGDGAFTLPRLAEFLWADYSLLDSWKKKGLIRPSVLVGKGTGNPSLYSHKDACIIRGLLRLRSGGLEFSALRHVARAWYAGDDALCPACLGLLPLELDKEET